MILFYLLISVMPLTRHPLWSAFVGEFTLVKILGLGCLGYSVWYALSRDRWPRLLGTPQAWCFLAMAGIAMLSAASLSLPVPFETSPLLSYVSFLILFFVTLVVVDSIHRLRFVLLAAVVSVGVASLYVLREWQKSLGMSVQVRPGWVAGDPNYFTVSAVMCLPVAFYLMQARGPRWQRLVCGACLLLTLPAVSLASSRGGFLGLVLAAGYVIVRSKRRLAIVTALAALILLLDVVSPISPMERFLRPTVSDETSREIREAFWRAGLNMVMTHPLTGIGLGNFKPLVGQYMETPIGVQGVAHNAYVEVAAELGLFGLAAFVGVLVGTYVTLGRVRRHAKRLGHDVLVLAAQGMQAGLLGGAIAIGFVSGEYQKLLWLMVFVSMTMPALVPKRANPTTAAPRTTTGSVPMPVR